MERKKFLPYSKPLSELQQRGQIPNNDVYLFIGNHAWRKAKGFAVSYPERTLALPAWFCPGEYHWPVNQCDILIIDTGFAEDDYLNDIAYHLYINGANVVRCITPDDKLLVFRK